MPCQLRPPCFDAYHACSRIEYEIIIELLGDFVAQLPVHIRVYILATAMLFVHGYASASGAAPWCNVRDYTELCKYENAQACYEAVAKVGGFCRENYKVAGVTGEARFCVVTAAKRQCSYNNRGRCLRAAANMNGGCVENTERKLKKAWGRERELPEGFDDFETVIE